MPTPQVNSCDKGVLRDENRFKNSSGSGAVERQGVLVERGVKNRNRGP